MPETNTKLGDYREKQLVARLPKGQGGGTIPIVIDNKQIRQRIFNLEEPLTISETMQELKKLTDEFEAKDGQKKYTYQVMMKLDDIGWRSGHWSNIGSDSVANFPQKYKIADANTGEEIPYDGEVTDVIINMMDYDPQFDKSYEPEEADF